MRTNEHNHDPSFDNVAHPAYRRRNDQQVEEIRELMRNTASGSRAITSLMEARHPDQPWKRKDVENEITRARTESLGGYSPTQALIRTFRDRNIKHFIRQLEGFITGLIWTYPHCEQLWKRYPDLLSLDNTYKTNPFQDASHEYHWRQQYQLNFQRRLLPGKF